MDVERDGKAIEWRRGWWIFVLLAALTGVEFVVSLSLASPLPYLAAIAVGKAALIIIYFMRLGDLRVLWRGGQEVGE